MNIKRALIKFASSKRLRPVLLGVVAFASICIGIAAYGTGLLNTLEGQSVDKRFSIRGNQRAPRNIVLVNLDPKTFRDLDQQFPLPRALEGKLISEIAAEHPAAIAFDVQLSEKSLRGQNDDVALLNALGAHHNRAGRLTVFSNTEPYVDGSFSFLHAGDDGRKLLRYFDSVAGNGGFPTDAGGVVRKTPYELNGLTSLDVLTAERAIHRKISPSEYPGGEAWIDFRGPAGTYPSVSFSTVVGYKRQRAKEKLPKDFFKGKIVVVGATASNLQDIHTTPTDSLMPGPEIHANAIDTILRNFPLSSAPGWFNVFLIVLLGGTVPLVTLRLGARAATGSALVFAAVFVVAVQLAFNSGTVVSFVYPLGALIISSTGSLAVQLVTEAFERVRVRDLFARFVPENVVDEVLKSADGLRLGGVQREGTVMFTDLRGFTSVAESLTPERVIDVLNHYLSEMSDAILDHGGTLVAYMGDGIMAVFGAPLAQQDHADRALATAREMLTVRLPRFNAWLRAEGLSEGFKMGIGLNSGHVMSGHVGSERRVEYTAVGDTTNTASRIEAMTKGTPHQLLLSEATKQALSSAPADLVFFEDVAIRGRVETVKLWTIGDPVPAPEIKDRPAVPSEG